MLKEGFLNAACNYLHATDARRPIDDIASVRKNGGDRCLSVWIFETFFDTKDKYSLKVHTTESYVRDPHFRAHGAAVYIPDWDPQPRWVNAVDLPALFARIPWERVSLLCHHAHFDGLILAHHYGVRPALWLDTLSMARLLLGNHLKAGLGDLAKLFGLALKTVPYALFDGRQWEALSPETRASVASGACQDVLLTVELFCRHLAPHFPRSEYPLVDATVRMFTEPVLRADPAALSAIEAAEQERKAALLRRINIDDPSELRSNILFAARLREAGIDPYQKKGKNGSIYAFAATDPFMEELLQSEDEEVVALAEARLAVQSSITETRTRRLIAMNQRGPLCPYLTYAGAATTRWSGGDRCNFQNLTPEIQAVIHAADDNQVLIVVDASQIECRILNYQAGQSDVIERFRAGVDPYVTVASAFYGYPVTKETHPTERQVGKVLELQCGYGSGGDKIRRTLRIKAGINLDWAEGMQARDAYRDTHPDVVAYWREAETRLYDLMDRRTLPWGPLGIEEGCLWLPNGAPLIYDTLKHEENAWLVQRRSGWQKLYGAKLVENVVQALARVYIGEVMNKVLAQRLKIALMRHDDIVICVDKHAAADVFLWLQDIMRQPPTWAPKLPLDCGGHIGRLKE